MNRYVVVFCDDQDRFRTEFEKNHKDYYDIINVDNTDNLIQVLDNLKKLPDIVLLDLYHPRDHNDDFEERRLKAEAELTKLDEQIEITNQAVLEVWEPHGIEILKSIRLKYPVHKLPVAIYTQKGLILLEDNKLREVEQLGAHWLLKKKLSPNTEKTRIDRIIIRDKQLGISTSESTKWYRIALAISWLFVGLLASRLFLDTNNFRDIVLSIFIAMLTALVTFLLTPLLEVSVREK